MFFQKNKQCVGSASIVIRVRVRGGKGAKNTNKIFNLKKKNSIIRLNLLLCNNEYVNFNVVMVLFFSLVCFLSLRIPIFPCGSGSETLKIKLLNQLNLVLYFQIQISFRTGLALGSLCVSTGIELFMDTLHLLATHISRREYVVEKVWKNKTAGQWR